MKRKQIVTISSISIAVVLLAVLAVAFGPGVYDRYRIAKLADLPLKSTLSIEADGDISGTRHTYGFMGVGVTDIGKIRIAVLGLRFSGESTGGVIISSPDSGESSGSTGTGDRRFTDRFKDGVTTCTFGGLTFTIERGTLELLGREFDIVDDEPKVVVVGHDGTIDDIVDITGDAEPSEPAGFVQIGGICDTIGKGQHHGRVSLAEIVARPHFYGVGALEELQGEITILDSKAFVSSVGEDSGPLPIENRAVKATLLAGQSVEEWIELTVTEEVPHDQFDETIAQMAAGQGIDLSRPFVFVVEGAFCDVHLHIINGACPVHARKQNLTIEKEKQPFELTLDALDGTLVAVYATDSAGTLTRPATSKHAHLIYFDEKRAARITGHLERVGLAKGAVLKLPKGNR